MYDLEPLQNPPSESEQLDAFGFSLENNDTLGVCIMRNIKIHSLHTDLAIVDPGHDNCVEFTRLGFGRVPDLIRAKKPAFFVHPKLRLPGVCNHFIPLVEGEAKGVKFASFKHLVRLEIKTVSLREALTAVQALLVHLAASFLSHNPFEQEEAEDCISSFLSPWTQALLACVDAGIPKSTSPWQDWLLGESKLRFSRTSA